MEISQQVAGIPQLRKRGDRYKLRQARINYNANQINNSTNKCRKAWDMINSVKNVPKRKLSDNNITVDEFSNYFVDSVEQIRSKTHCSKISAGTFLSNVKQKNCVFTWRPVSNLELYQLVMDLSNSRSQDHYGFSNHLIKSIIHVILDPLVFIINQCLDQGEFPDCLKISKVIPVFKKGNTSIVSNYRPISMVPVLSKVIESVMLKQLMAYFEENELLYDDQFGFRPGNGESG